MPTLTSYFNPRSNDHDAWNVSRELPALSSYSILAGSIVVGALTFGLGGCALFRALVERASTEPPGDVQAIEELTKNILHGGEEIAQNVLQNSDNEDLQFFDLSEEKEEEIQFFDAIEELEITEIVSSSPIEPNNQLEVGVLPHPSIDPNLPVIPSEPLEKIVDDDPGDYRNLVNIATRLFFNPYSTQHAYEKLKNKLLPPQQKAIEEGFRTDELLKKGTGCLDLERFPGTDTEKRQALRFTYSYNLLLDLIGNEATHPLFSKEGLYYKQLLAIRPPSLRSRCLARVGHLIKNQPAPVVLESKSFKKSGVPLLLLYCELLQCLPLDKAEQAYKQVLSLGKALKDNTRHAALLCCLQNLVNYPIRPENKLKIVHSILESKKMIKQRANQWDLVFSAPYKYNLYVVRGPISPQSVDRALSLLESKNFSMQVVKFCFQLFINEAVNWLDLDPMVDWQAAKLIGSCRDPSVFSALIAKIKIIRSAYGGRYGLKIENSCKAYLRAAFEGNYREIRNVDLEKLGEGCFSEAEVESWQQGIRREVGDCVIKDTDDPWDLLLGTTDINGCQSIFSPETGRYEVLTLFSNPSSRIIRFTDRNGTLIARAYITLDPKTRTAKMELDKQRNARQYPESISELKQHLEIKMDRFAKVNS